MGVHTNLQAFLVKPNSGFAIFVYPEMNLRYDLVNPRTTLTLVIIIGTRKLSTSAIFLGSRYNLSTFITWPMKVMFWALKQHLLGLSFKCTSFRRWRTIQMCCKWSFQFRLWMLTSSTKTFKNLLFQSLKTSAMVHEKIPITFFKPKGMTLHSYNPNLVMVAIFWCLQVPLQFTRTQIENPK